MKDSHTNTLNVDRNEFGIKTNLFEIRESGKGGGHSIIGLGAGYITLSKSRIQPH